MSICEVSTRFRKIHLTSFRNGIMILSNEALGTVLKAARVPQTTNTLVAPPLRGGNVR